jgi:hypothetical protein
MFKRPFLLVVCGLFIVGVASFTAGWTVGEDQVNQRVYELRTYTTLPGRLPALHKRFADHTLALFEKHGMKNEMYWTPLDESLKDNTLIYIVSHDSKEAAEKSWKAFQADPEWHKARDASEADGKIVAKVERVYMTQVPWQKAK